MSVSGWGTRHVLIVAGFGGGALVASLVWILVWLSPGSDDLLKVAAWRLFRAGSYHVAMDLQYHGTDSRGAASDLRLESEGDVARQADGFLTAQDFTLTLGSAARPVTLGGRYARQAGANLVTLRQVPARLGGFSLQIFQDKTMSVDLERTLAKMPNLPFLGGLSLTDADLAELTDTAAGLPFLSITQRLQDEKLRGVSVYHYKVKPEIVYVRDFLKIVEAKRLGRDLTVKEQNAYDATFANFSAEDGELWLGSGDYFVQRLRLRLRRSDDRASGLWTVTLDFSRFNQPTSLARVETSGVEDASPYLDSLLAAYASHLPMAQAGTGRRSLTGDGRLPASVFAVGSDDADADGLNTLLERFYGTDALNPDSDGDGVSDGREVEAMRSPLGPWGLFDFTGGQFQ